MYIHYLISSNDDSFTEDSASLSPTSSAPPKPIDHTRTAPAPTTPRTPRRNSENSYSGARDTPPKTPTTPTPRRKVLGGSGERRSVSKGEKGFSGVDRKSTNNSNTGTQGSTSKESSSFQKTYSFRDNRTSSEKRTFVRSGSVREKARASTNSSTVTPPARKPITSPNPERHSMTATGSVSSSRSVPPKSPAPKRKSYGKSPQTSSQQTGAGKPGVSSRSKSRDTKGARQAPSSSMSENMATKRSSKASSETVPVGVTPPSSPRPGRGSESVASDISSNLSESSLHSSGEFLRRYNSMAR